MCKLVVICPLALIPPTKVVIWPLALIPPTNQFEVCVMIGASCRTANYIEVGHQSKKCIKSFSSSKNTI